MELRLPTKLIHQGLSSKKLKAVRMLAAAKLRGHRCNVKLLYADLGMSEKTGLRWLKLIVGNGWAGFDGVNIYPRSWRKINFSKRGGLYLTEIPTDAKKFEALSFAVVLKKKCRNKQRGSTPVNGRVEQANLPASLLTKMIGISQRRFERLKASAKRYGFLKVTEQFQIIGRACELPALRTNLSGLRVFRHSKYSVCPEPSKIDFLI